jgi:hypothetical protein
MGLFRLLSWCYNRLQLFAFIIGHVTVTVKRQYDFIGQYNTEWAVCGLSIEK